MPPPCPLTSELAKFSSFSGPRGSSPVPESAPDASGLPQLLPQPLHRMLSRAPLRAPPRLRTPMGALRLAPVLSVLGEEGGGRRWAVADLGGAGGPWRGEMVFGTVLKGGPGGGGIFWPVGQKFWPRGEMKSYIRHCRWESGNTQSQFQGGGGASQKLKAQQPGKSWGFTQSLILCSCPNESMGPNRTVCKLRVFVVF